MSNTASLEKPIIIMLFVAGLIGIATIGTQTYININEGWLGVFAFVLILIGLGILLIKLLQRGY